MNETIHIILTGGTIDSVFDPVKDGVVIGKETVVEDYLKKLRLHNSLEVTLAFLKDSREIRHADRKKLLELVQKSPHKKILITHGTYTMPDSAQYLKENIAKTSKTIVFTGSMVPLTGFQFSDAAFNLGYAIGQLQSLKPGVYVCMNGKAFDPDRVDKNTVQGRFEEIG